VFQVIFFWLKKIVKTIKGKKYSEGFSSAVPKDSEEAAIDFRLQILA